MAVRLLLALGFTLLPLSLSAAPPLASPEIDRIAEQILKDWEIPGVAVVIVRGDESAVKGYGVRKIGTTDPITPETIFPLASCSKGLTTTLLAILADEGVITWDDPVRKHLPDFHLSEPNADALVTLRDLLSHRTGVQGHDMVWYRAPWDQAEVLRRANFLPVERTFRGSYEYSTIMVMAAAHGACKTAGKPWQDLLRQKLIEPLGMESVSYCTADPQFAKGVHATGHDRIGGKWQVMPYYETREPNPAGSLAMPAKSMVPWLKLQLGKGKYGDRRIVSEANLIETWTPQNLIPMSPSLRRLNPDTIQMTYGMGWLSYDYRGKRVVAHGGMIDGFRIHVQVMPEDNLAIALFNNAHDNKMNQALANALVDHLLELPNRDWNRVLLDAVRTDRQERQETIQKRNQARRPEIKPNLPLSDYAGSYENKGYGTAEIRLVDGQLHWEWSAFKTPMEHWQEDAFRITDGFLEDHIVEFRATPGGVTALRFLGSIFERKKVPGK